MSAPVRQGLPFAPAKALRLSEGERRQLIALGWKDGDPVPGKLGQILQDVRAQMEKEEQEEIQKIATSGRPRLHVAEPIPIEQLSPEKQEEIRLALSTAKQQLAAFAQDQAAQRAPSVQREVERMRLEEEAGSAAREAMADADASAEEQRSEPPPAQPPAPPGQPPAKPPDPVVSDQDKRVFVASLIGGQPFCKEYTLYGGELTVVFAAGDLKDVDLAYQQAATDAQMGRVTPEMVIARLFDYQLLLSLQKLSSEHGKLELQEKAQQVRDGMGPKWIIGQDTGLVDLYDECQKEPMLRNQGVWRALVNQFQSFLVLNRFLESKAPDPSFWLPAGT
jgi:hypothetical protein